MEPCRSPLAKIPKLPTASPDNLNWPMAYSAPLAGLARSVLNLCRLSMSQQTLRTAALKRCQCHTGGFLVTPWLTWTHLPLRDPEITRPKRKNQKVKRSVLGNSVDVQLCTRLVAPSFRHHGWSMGRSSPESSNCKFSPAGQKHTDSLHVCCELFKDRLRGYKGYQGLNKGAYAQQPDK